MINVCQKCRLSDAPRGRTLCDDCVAEAAPTPTPKSPNT